MKVHSPRSLKALIPLLAVSIFAIWLPQLARAADWKTIRDKDQLTDQEQVTAFSDYKFDEIIVQASFKCVRNESKVSLLFVMLNDQLKPYGAFKSSDFNSEMVEIVHRLDNNEPVTSFSTRQYRNATELKFQNITFTNSQGVAIKPPAEINHTSDLKRAKRLRVRLPISQLGNPVLDIDLGAKALSDFKAACPVLR
jgi:hypothetical protein